MMRSPHALVVAVRRPGGEIVYKETKWLPLSERYPFLKWPVLRGGVILFETLANGIQALSFSASQALDEENKELSSWALGLTIGFAFALAIALFVVRSSSPQLGVLLSRRGLGMLLVLLEKPLDSTGRIDEFLLPGVEGVTARANLHADALLGGAAHKFAPAMTPKGTLMIGGMNVFLHSLPLICASRQTGPCLSPPDPVRAHQAY